MVWLATETPVTDQYYLTFKKVKRRKKSGMPSDTEWYGPSSVLGRTGKQ